MHDESIAGVRVSPQQKHLWLLQQAENGLPYRAQCAIRIEGALDRARLKRAFAHIVDQWEILRTAFRCLPGMTVPLQVITTVPFIWRDDYDRGTLSDQEQADMIETLFQELLLQPFDLTQSPLVRTALVILSPSKHVLLVSIPALCADAITLRNLVRQLSRAYAADGHTDAPADEEIMQYADIAEWQNDLLEIEDTEPGRAYWRKRDVTALLAGRLPLAKRPVEHAGFQPQALTSTINPDSVARIELLTQKYATSPSAFLLACWMILFWRITGQADITVGTASYNRKYKELEDALGIFAKYLPLSCHLEESVQFSTLLSQVQSAKDEMYEFEEYFSWNLITPPDADGTARPFFPVCFDFDEHATQFSADDVSFIVYKQYICVDRFNIKLSCLQKGDQLITELHYDANVFSADYLTALNGQYQTLLEHALQNPTAAIRELEALNAVERQRVLYGFNETQADYPVDMCLHQLFEAQVERTPDLIAVVFDGRTPDDQGSPTTTAEGRRTKGEASAFGVQLTYAELNARANQLAHYLQACAVGPERLVGIYAERSLELVVGLMGILKAGGAYLPLDPTYPPERLAFMLQDAHAPVLLTLERLKSTLPRSDARVIYLDSDWGMIAQSSMEPPTSTVTAGNLAYVIYTSGSTGFPKGVMIHHRAICNHMLWMQASLPLTHEDRILQKTPFSFDASVWEFYAPLLAGAQVVIARPGGHQDSTYLSQAIVEHTITILQLVPSMLRLLLEEPSLASCDCLRRVCCGGEALDLQLQERLFKRLPVDVYNLYGPTETAIETLFWTCERESARPIVPIGRPITNTQVYVLDNRLRPVPIGVPGELYIGGLSLGRGYLNRPELTAERFIPNPFAGDTETQVASIDYRLSAIGNRLYRTGDLARYWPDGSVEFIGRADNQVKVRGFRIELGEIETVLGQHPAVRGNAVVVREDTPGDQRLVAYIVVTEDERRKTKGEERDPSFVLHPSSFVQELRAFLREKLPDYMVPSAFVVLSALPLTPSGKIDRRALPRPETVSDDLERDFIAPRTSLEAAVAQIWAEALGRDRISVHDNFFMLGGHSLLTTQVNARVRDMFQVELPLRSLFEAPTVADFATLIIQHIAEQVDSETLARVLADFDHLPES
jgi:amino acid adenylation domain-containing protein